MLAIRASIEQDITNLMAIVDDRTFFGIPMKVDVLQIRCHCISHIQQYFWHVSKN